ncbi:MAG: T9SS type A sorting domain-containing protein [Melioribacteraceae bacterium]|nr:T9SS type A sorting domain-containing protein [Melioribacteraceae bacterium]
MIIKLTILLFSLILNTAIIAQYQAVKISNDNTPSTILQSNPKIYKKSNDIYLVAWKDLRQGTNSYYAQGINSDLMPVGSNFKICSNLKTAFLNNSTYVTLNEGTYSYWYDVSGYMLEAVMYSESGSRQILIGADILPQCGMGWLGISNDLVAFDSSFLVAYRYSERIKIYRYDHEGNLLFEKNLTGYETDNYTSALSVELLSLPEYYIVSWAELSNIDNYYDKPTVNCMFNIYSIQDSLVNNFSVADCLLSEESVWEYNNSKTHRLTALNDTSFAIAYLDSSAIKVQAYSILGDTLSGNFNFDLDEVDFNTLSQQIINFSISEQIQNNLTIVFTWLDSKYLYNEYKIQIDLSLDETSVNYQNGLAEARQYGDDLYFDDMGGMLYGYDKEGDVYLGKIRDGSIIDSVKLNDDSSGSNESAHEIKIVNDDLYFCSWKDEKGYKGAYIDNIGNTLSDQLIPNTSNYLIRCDKSIVSLDVSEFNSEFTVELKHRNEYFNPVTNSLVITVTGYKPLLSNIIEFEDEIIFGVCTDKMVRLYRYDLLLNPKNEIQFFHNNRVDRLKLLSDERDIFWVEYDYNHRKYDKNLELISDAGYIYYNTFLGGDKFLQHFTTYPDSVSLWVLNSDNDTLANSTIGKGFEEIKVLPVNDRDIAVFYVSDNSIYVTVYDHELNITKSRKLLYNAAVGPIKNLRVASNSGSALIIFSDRETDESDYDIFVISLDIDLITGINEKSQQDLPVYNLADPFPNPFNPSAKIEFELAEDGFASLKVYNIIGEQVADLINGDFSSGNYSIVFNAGSLPAGVYIYTLVSGNYSASKKMVLLK